MPPTRSCIACRGKASPTELLRLVADADGEVLVDLGVQRSGRGAWLHPHHDCLRKLLRRPRALGHALRCQARVEGLEQRLHGVCMDSLTRLLPRASRAGCVVSGRHAILRDLGRGELRAIVAAADASPRSLAELEAACGVLPIYSLELDRLALGRLVGKGPRAALAVRLGSPGEPLLVELRRYTSLGYHPRRNRSGDRPEATRRAGTAQSRGRGLGAQSSPVCSNRKRGQPTGASLLEGSECPRKRS